MAHTIGPLWALAIPANKGAAKTYNIRFDLKTRLIIQIPSSKLASLNFEAAAARPKSEVGRQDLNAGGLFLSADRLSMRVAWYFGSDPLGAGMTSWIQPRGMR